MLKIRVSTLETKSASATSAVATAAPASTHTAVNALKNITSDLEKHMDDAEFQSQVILHWADSMHHDLHSVQKQIDFHSSKHHVNEVNIGGIYESKNTSCFEATKKFLTEKLSVNTGDNDIHSARRVGKQGKTIQVHHTDDNGDEFTQQVVCPRHMVVKCAPRFKNKIMEKKKMLAGQIDLRGFKYFLAQYLPESFKAAQEKHWDRVNDIYKANVKKEQKDHTQVRVTGPDLIINNRVQTGLIHPPHREKSVEPRRIMVLSLRLSACLKPALYRRKTAHFKDL